MLPTANKTAVLVTSSLSRDVNHALTLDQLCHPLTHRTNTSETTFYPYHLTDSW